MDALLSVARQLSKVDPNRLLANIQLVAMGDSRAPSAWMALFYDLKELDNVLHKLSQAGHDIRTAYRDFSDLRRWLYAVASTMSPRSSHSSRPKQSVPRSTQVLPTQSPSHRPPLTPSTRPEHIRPRVDSTVPPSPHKPHRSPRGQVVAPARVLAHPKARLHVRFAPTATVYTIHRHEDATPPPVERPSYSPRQSHARYVLPNDLRSPPVLSTSHLGTRYMLPTTYEYRLHRRLLLTGRSPVPSPRPHDTTPNQLVRNHLVAEQTPAALSS